MQLESLDRSGGFTGATEIVVAISSNRLSGCNVDGESVVPKIADSIRNLGVTFDSIMFLKSHISRLCKSLEYKIYSIVKIRKWIDRDTTRTLVVSSITSKCITATLSCMDCTILPSDLSNNVTRIITRQPKHAHITPELLNLHWLPVYQRIAHKVLLLTKNVEMEKELPKPMYQAAPCLYASKYRTCWNTH